jgi:hypothetical protein
VCGNARRRADDAKTLKGKKGALKHLNRSNNQLEQPFRQASEKASKRRSTSPREKEMFNDENLVREPREVEGYFEARNNRETGILVGQYLKATPIEQRREAQEDRPEYENKERAEEITKRLLGLTSEPE